MKELSIEEKAKAYDEAIERYKAKQEYESQRVHEFVEYLFPSLKESEDERIRKEIITYLSTVEDKELIPYEPWIAWLEKQGESKNIDSDDLATLEIWEDAIKENKEKWQLSDWFVEATSLLIQKVKRMENNENFNIKGSKIMLNACINVLRKVGHSHLSDWLEKQCETFTKKDVDDAYLKGVCDTKQELEKQSKQKTIMNTPPREVILSIWDLGNEWKELTNGSISTEYGTQLDYIQKHWHESEYYLKEKQSEQESAVYIPKFHVGDKLVSTKNPSLTYEVLEVGRINELGNPEYKVEIFTDGKVENPRNIHYMECHKVDEWAKLIEQKPTWSEEDEAGLGDALWAIQQARAIAKDENDMGNLWYAENWLKSLKDRVQPQPRQEWKPTEEQIMCLQDAIDGYHRRGYKAETLGTLFKQLKKLTE